MYVHCHLIRLFQIRAWKFIYLLQEIFRKITIIFINEKLFTIITSRPIFGTLDKSFVNTSLFQQLQTIRKLSHHTIYHDHYLIFRNKYTRRRYFQSHNGEQTYEHKYITSKRCRTSSAPSEQIPGNRNVPEEFGSSSSRIRIHQDGVRTKYWKKLPRIPQHECAEIECIASFFRRENYSVRIFYIV